MSGGLFDAVCPSCGSELASDGARHQRCSGCDRCYLDRFGYLIPWSPAQHQTADAPATAGAGDKARPA